MFEGTVFENIAYGNIDASTEDVWNAARLSESDKFISELPNQENTIVGERGQKLSGGQRPVSYTHLTLPTMLPV